MTSIPDNLWQEPSKTVAEVWKGILED
jgi:hypothetical protein